MAYGYNEFKKDVYGLTNINFEMYKERQMKRRIESLVARKGFDGFDFGLLPFAAKVTGDIFARDFLDGSTVSFADGLPFALVHEHVLAGFAKTTGYSYSAFDEFV